MCKDDWSIGEGLHAGMMRGATVNANCGRLVTGSGVSGTGYVTSVIYDERRKARESYVGWTPIAAD
jgi:hypothetical protein